MARFGALQDIDGHGVYVAVHDVVGLLPIRSGMYASEKEERERLYESGGAVLDSYVAGLPSQGFAHASLAPVEEIRARIEEFEQDAEAKRNEKS